MLAVSSLATYGILLAGLIISPSIMRIICRKQGELQEKLKPSQSAAKQRLVDLILPRAPWVLFFIYFLFDLSL
jgi:hypothetical protein